MVSRDPNSKTWPYVEFLTAEGARTIQTNEDGTVYWSDDIHCWGSRTGFRHSESAREFQKTKS